MGVLASDAARHGVRGLDRYHRWQRHPSCGCGARPRCDPGVALDWDPEPSRIWLGGTRTGGIPVLSGLRPAGADLVACGCPDGVPRRFVRSPVSDSNDRPANSIWNTLSAAAGRRPACSNKAGLHHVPLVDQRYDDAKGRAGLGRCSGLFRHAEAEPGQPSRQRLPSGSLGPDVCVFSGGLRPDRACDGRRHRRDHRGCRTAASR